MSNSLLIDAGRQETAALVAPSKTPAASCPSSSNAAGQNVSQGERVGSLAAGSLLALLGLGRRDRLGLLIAGLGGGLLYRGATGNCALYSALGIDSAHQDHDSRIDSLGEQGVNVSQSFSVNKSPEELYAFWRDFTNLPRFMTHLKSVKVLDNHRSHWIATAPWIFGGQVEWDAEITSDQPNSLIVWRSLEGSDIEHRGSVKFTRGLGDRGTAVKVGIDYRPPAGQLGKWIAKLFGEEPEQQIREDLRNFKRIVEIGEIPTTEGQPKGSCTASSSRVSATARKETS